MILKHDNIALDTERYEAKVKEKEIRLSMNEFKLLRMFLENKNTPLTRDDISKEVGIKNGDSVIVHVSNLRKKIGAKRIKTMARYHAYILK